MRRPQRRGKSLAPQQTPQAVAPSKERTGVSLDEGGLTAHWSAPRPQGGRLSTQDADSEVAAAGSTTP